MVVELGKGEVVSLKKGAGTLVVRLEWSTRTDVDLGCMYRLRDGQAHVVQALDTLGDFNKPPYIALDGDKRAGGVETLRINLDHASEFERLLVFAFVYQGGGWGSVKDARVTLTHPTQGEYVFALGGGLLRRLARGVALAELAGTGDDLKLTILGEYVMGTHQAIDSKCGFGLNWTPGSK